MNGDIPAQKVFAHTTKGTEKITKACPQALNSIGMNFANAIAIVVACPFVLTVTDHRTRAADSVVAIILIGVYVCAFACEAFHMGTQGHLFGVRRDAETHLSGLTSDGAHHRRTVIGKGTWDLRSIGRSCSWRWIGIGYRQ